MNTTDEKETTVKVPVSEKTLTAITETSKAVLRVAEIFKTKYPDNGIAVLTGILGAAAFMLRPQPALGIGGDLQPGQVDAAKQAGTMLAFTGPESLHYALSGLVGAMGNISDAKDR